jgi:Serine/threonine protein kinase involved in cell cycle control
VGEVVYVSKRLEKDSELYEVLEGVFDYWTVMGIYKLMSKGIIARLFGAVASGKEARVYWGKSPSGKDLAVKIFYVQASSFRGGRLKYIAGDPRFEGLRGDFRKLVYAWCLKEYRNLKRAYESGVPVPRPYAAERNILVMEFIGKNGVPAPLLKEKTLSDPARAFSELKEYIKRLYWRAKLVHADLSEYNVMVDEGDRLVIIDLGSAVLASHPMAREFLRKDVENIYRFFSGVGVNTGSPEEFLEELLSGVH